MLSLTTLGQKPSVPQKAFLHPSNNSVRLDLFDWNDETCPVSYFVVEYRKRMVSQVQDFGKLKNAQNLDFRAHIGRWSATTFK